MNGRADLTTMPGQAEGRSEAYLLYRDGEGIERVVELGSHRDRITLGRGASADVRLSWDLGVSRLHAALERLGDRWTLFDDRLSRNGSFINGDRLSGRRLLVDGDNVQLGSTVLGFHAPTHSDGTETVPALDVATRPNPSPAQRRVLVALCRPFVEGQPFATLASNRELASELVLSVDAIKSHLQALYRAFEVDTVSRSQKRLALVRRALATGEVSARDYAPTTL